ncbi:hypothetical protein Niako_3331 [Niastella koreensis GR20-10]|uniref:Uncharacterized protein n=1 Tax=Niastella koreensis (strain DSM 17620 / KACC 11465 / NBRC 106392 / GR20-10) TaxID=700598 RepID=G8TI43_NIAKG|nr:hypothetical protein Niako_3331 [Niastella koreensis GR20-10]
MKILTVVHMLIVTTPLFISVPGKTLSHHPNNGEIYRSLRIRLNHSHTKLIRLPAKLTGWQKKLQGRIMGT